jgi:hypothetical protein
MLRSECIEVKTAQWSMDVAAEVLLEVEARQTEVYDLLLQNPSQTLSQQEHRQQPQTLLRRKA